MLDDLFESTTAAGRRNKAGASFVASLCLMVPAWSSTSSRPDDRGAFPRYEVTSAGPRLAATETLIAKIRRLSGLTWEQLALLCGTSRRTLHLWASGRRMHVVNEARLLRIVALLEQIDAGSSDQNRRRLLEVGPEGQSAVDLIAADLLDEAAAVLDVQVAGAAVLDAAPVSWSMVAEPAPKPWPASRRPPPPADLLDALHDPVHEEPGPSPRPRFGRLRGGK